MEEIYKAVEERLARLAADIRIEMDSKGINASHRTERALKVYRYDGGVRLVIGAGDVAPLETLEVGVKAGVQKDTPTFRAVLFKWSRDKGISFASDKERARFAYFLSKRIEREGTLRNKQPEDVYSSAARVAVRDIRIMLRQNYEKIITNKIHKFK